MLQTLIFLASFAFKSALPYRGLGTGIRRATADWPNIFFDDNRELNEFKAIVYRASKVDSIVHEENPSLTTAQDTAQDTAQVTAQATAQATAQVTAQVTAQAVEQAVLQFCQEPKSRTEIMNFLGLKHRQHFKYEILDPLLAKGLLVQTIPEKPNSPKQKYRVA
ncbi:MAG: hypothetical protein LDLANPLL_01624 [Turneriella sp.]|nr:hypothetical protein [Turneriella sp.]